MYFPKILSKLIRNIDPVQIHVPIDGWFFTMKFNATFTIVIGLCGVQFREQSGKLFQIR